MMYITDRYKVFYNEIVPEAALGKVDSFFTYNIAVDITLRQESEDTDFDSISRTQESGKL